MFLDLAIARLSQDFQHILDLSAGKPLKLSEIIHILHGRGINILLILLALPFCIPIPLPGVSTPFGLIILFIGLRLALRKKPWLPQHLLNYEIPYLTLARLIKVGLAASSRLEKILYPRFLFFNRWKAFNILNGVLIMLNGFLLLLPLPIPFSNTIPAWSIVLLGAGLMEEDGIVIVVSYFVSAAAWGYLVMLYYAGKTGMTFFGY